eukprot:CAMPEP_0183295568 /NCGR_PEP_ID=MMETSP0160_2-20130417/3482_1 /TAXON_ID=2839 ORGANISM="Odontella Sinensis, Strain Grunow 1884" /NCGR_SAMPLE_ID=MMETSP0160_2 /ASSEMBLY_ACC=CAM_ASM_000250 /LENGTH=269 /DNA_ID=CAMNT_0025457073 /DNA_START=418 /DNA_END=1227 /DNA_ORIENTATION=+
MKKLSSVENANKQWRRHFPHRQGWKKRNIFYLLLLISFAAVPVQSIRGICYDQQVTRMEKVARSFEPVLSQSDDQKVDVARLLAACRSYAELTQEMGQTAVARDMESNIRKAERLFSVAPAHERRYLASLLELERKRGMHGPGGELSDSSAAAGLLWLRRSIAFQTELYSALLRSIDPKEAALEAYRSQVQPYHGWMLRRLFTTKFLSMMPPRRDMLATLGGFPMNEFGDEEEKTTLQDLEHLVLVWRPILSHWKRTYEELDLEDTRQV